MKIHEYIKEDGSSPYKTWFDNLNAQDAARVISATCRLELGNTTGFRWLGEIGEFLIKGVPCYRIYIIQDGIKLVALFGSQEIKQSPECIGQAKSLYSEYKTQRYAGGDYVS